MNSLDIESILEKNPQVDKSAIKERKRLIKEFKKKPATQKQKGNPYPFGGRRNRPFEEGWKETAAPNRPHYRTI